MEGNEQVDRLAGKATVSESKAMDHSDVLNALKDSVHLDDFRDCSLG